MDLAGWFRRNRQISLRAGVAVLALAGLALVYLATGMPVRLVVDGQSADIRTHARTVGAALHDAGWDLSLEDRVGPPRESRVAAGMTIRLDHAYPVVVEVNGESSIVVTPETIPANILGAAGVALFPGDEVWVDGLRIADPGRDLGHSPARVRLSSGSPITLSQDGTTRTIRSGAATIGQALWEAGIVLRSADRLSPSSETPLVGPIAASLQSSRPVTIEAEGEELAAWVTANTVGHALAEAGLVPVGLDYAVPGLQDPIPEDGRIRLIRVTEQVTVEQRPLPFETTYQPLPDLEIDNQRLIEAGAYGVVANRVRIRLEDGQEVGRTVEGEWLAVEPRPEVVGYGTQIVVRTVSTSDGPLEYWRAVTMYATSYSASRAGTPVESPWYGITASGKPLTKGLVAIDRSLIPFGTRMYVIGYGYAEAADTGGGVHGRWIDLGYDEDNFVNWHQYVTVYFLTPVPSLDSIVWIFP